MILNFTILVSDPITVAAVVGDKAAIPCSVSTPLEADQATLILWYKVGMPNPIYTLDIRNVPFKGAKHFPSTEMGSRAHFDVSVHPPVLVLSPVFEDDQGEYKCRVDLRRSRTLIIHSRLRVIGNKTSCVIILKLPFCKYKITKDTYYFCEVIINISILFFHYKYI